MANFIKQNYMGVKITLAVTGLPVTITGEVIYSAEPELVSLRLENGTRFSINGSLIAFVF